MTGRCGQQVVSVLKLRPLTLGDYHLKKWTKVKSAAPVRRTLAGRSALDVNQVDVVSLSLYGGNPKRETLVNCFRCRSCGNFEWRAQCEKGQRALSGITPHDMCLDDPDGADVDFLLLYLNSCLAFDYQPDADILAAVVASQSYLFCSSASWEHCVAALLQLAELCGSDAAMTTATNLLARSAPGVLENLQPTGALMWLYAATRRADDEQGGQCLQELLDSCSRVIARCVTLLEALQMTPTEVAEMIRLITMLTAKNSECLSHPNPCGSTDVKRLVTAYLASASAVAQKLRLPEVVAVWGSLVTSMAMLEDSVKASVASEAIEVFDVLAHKTYVVADLVPPADAIRVLELIHNEPSFSARYKKLPAALVDVIQAVDDDFWLSQPNAELERMASSLVALVVTHNKLADVVRCVESIRLAKAAVDSS